MIQDIMDMGKVLGAGTIGFITQLTAVDLALKVIVGGLTAFYIVLKIIEILRGWKKKG